MGLPYPAALLTIGLASEAALHEPVVYKLLISGELRRMSR